MPGLIEAIFNSKNNVYEAYNKKIRHEASSGTKVFDHHKKQFFYGRIDRSGDAISLEAQGNVGSTYSEKKTNFLVDFANDAFNDLRRGYRARIYSGDLEKNSFFGQDLVVKKAWRDGDLEYEYHHYTNQIYTNFVQNYLTKDRRHEKITNFKSFVTEFMRYYQRIAYNFPLTKTGYILSVHCSPYSTGLMLALNHSRHGTQDSKNVINYASDPNFLYILNESRKYGFMVDRTAPWRLVFNLSSGYQEENQDNLRGGAYYMNEYGQTFDNVFSNYFSKTHLTELNNIQKLLRDFYIAYYNQFSTYDKIIYQHVLTDVDGDGVPDWTAPGDRKLPADNCYSIKIKTAVVDREPYPIILGTIEEVQEYYLKIILKLRMLETNYKHTDSEFSIFLKKMIEEKRSFSTEAALNYINDLTKGFRDSKFITKGKYWYGENDYNHALRMQQAARDRNDPDRVDYELTGTGNIIRG